MPIRHLAPQQNPETAGNTPSPPPVKDTTSTQPETKETLSWAWFSGSAQI